VKNYQDKGYPFEAIWTDIYYMENLTDFTVDSQPGKPYEGIQNAITGWHNKNVKFIPILDAGISIADTDSRGKKYFDKLIKTKTFMKSAQNPDKYSGAIIGQVWPGKCGFVDYLADNATSYWLEGLSDLYDLASFDGIWIDMNEPSNFDDCKFGECPDLIIKK